MADRHAAHGKEVEYDSVLVAFEDNPFHEETVATAARLAAHRRRGIHVISLFNVPLDLSLDEPLAEEESAAQSKVEQAKLVAGQRVTGHVTRVRPGQAGNAIADEAESIRAEAIVMQLDYRGQTPLYGRTLQTVLRRRPCRVIVVAQPQLAAAAPRRAMASSA